MQHDQHVAYHFLNKFKHKTDTTHQNANTAAKHLKYRQILLQKPSLVTR